MLVSQCPCAGSGEITLNVIDPSAGQCPPPCEVSASATITIQEPDAISAYTLSKRVTGTTGYLSAGVRSASVLNDGGNDATVNGATIKAGTSLMFPVLGGNTVYGAITYDATDTTLRWDWTAWGADAPITTAALVEL